MKIHTILITASGVLMSLACLQAQSTTLLGDHFIAGSLEVRDDLSVGGNAIDFGTTVSSNSAVVWQYSDGTNGTNSTLTLSATRSGAGFLWQDNAPGTALRKMRLDSTNTLTLFQTNGTTEGVVLSPNGTSLFAGSVVISGADNRMPAQTLMGIDSILTRGLADQRYLQTGLSWSGLTNTSAAALRADLGLGYLGTNAATTRTNLELGWAGTNEATTRTNLGLGATNDVEFKTLKLSTLVFGGSSTGFLGRTPNGAITLYGTNVLTAEPSFYGWDGFSAAAISRGQARTNLGLAFLGTNSAAARSGLGLAPTSTVTFGQLNVAAYVSGAAFVQMQSGGALVGVPNTNPTSVPTFYGSDGFAGTVMNPAQARAHLGLGYLGTNAATTRTNLGLGASWLTNTLLPTTTNAADLTAGILPDGRLSTNVMFRTAGLLRSNNLADLTNVGQARTNLQMGATNFVRFGSVEAANVEGTQMVFIGDGGILRFETSAGSIIMPDAFNVLADDGFMEIGLPVVFLNGAAGPWRDALGLGPFATATSLVATNISDFVTAVSAAAPSTTNAGALTAGTLADARLSTNVVVRDASGLLIAGTQNPNLFYVAAGTDRVGIGTNAPAATLHVAGNARIDGALRISPQGDLSMGVYTNAP
jgi:hypothetical protein